MGNRPKRLCQVMGRSSCKLPLSALTPRDAACVRPCTCLLSVALALITSMVTFPPVEKIQMSTTRHAPCQLAWHYTPLLLPLQSLNCHCGLRRAPVTVSAVYRDDVEVHAAKGGEVRRSLKLQKLHTTTWRTDGRSLSTPEALRSIAPFAGKGSKQQQQHLAP